MVTEVNSLFDAIRILVEDIDQIVNLIDQEAKTEPKTVDDWLLNMAEATAQSAKAGIMLSRIGTMGWQHGTEGLGKEFGYEIDEIELTIGAALQKWTGLVEEADRRYQAQIKRPISE